MRRGRETLDADARRLLQKTDRPRHRLYNCWRFDDAKPAESDLSRTNLRREIGLAAELHSS